MLQLLCNDPVCSKQIGPGQWDLSLAEHLAPGESYRQVIYLPQAYLITFILYVTVSLLQPIC